jgi:hypothetical protein
VLKLGRGTFDVLREGLVSKEDLRDTAGLRLGFLLHGQHLPQPDGGGAGAQGARAAPRGPAGAHRKVRLPRALDGAYAQSGSPASEHAVTLLKAEGCDLSSHRSRQATLEDLLTLDRVYG